ncbi:HlyC/CorC family transporter [Mobilitalea sibirica]|uniref:HlyC/CorC family transporter n=1 Tax=Mobilitalea sibirica TaxID=1462919 RepID=A0A8J7HC56_9FIRM|nr:hemolysin family protein [Mobilitalea sibirica]MBH1940657.1 HlyC/CorC family transporter [Mobilitalea sibirica]
MDSSDVARPIILAFLLISSAFFSGSETALTTVNKLRIRSLADDDVKGARTILKMIEEPGKMLSAILIGNNIVNLYASSLATQMAYDAFGSKWISLVTGLLTLFILIFGEITPKSMSTIYAEKISLKIAGFIYFLTVLLTPFIFIINNICIGIMKLLRIDPKAKTSAITENELRTILDYSHEEGVIESEERRMITNVVDFGDALAKDVMVPRIDMAFASVDLTYDELVQAFAEDKYTRMPVYSDTRDNVIGIVNLKDVFFYSGEKEDFNIVDILRDPYFTYEFKKTSELLIEMRRNSISLAIVLDEYGATAGLITIEDLLEEIVGEIRDEYDDDEEDSIRVVNEYEYIVDGNTKLDDINEGLGLNLESDDYDSIAGHIIYLLDHLPEEGETVTDNNVVFTVAAVDKNRIDKVHILLKKEDEEDEDED